MPSRSRRPAPGSPAITYDWYRTFLQTLLDNNAYTWFAPLITFGEMAVGLGLLIGLPDRLRGLLRGPHEHVVPARRLGLGQPGPVHPGDRLMLAWKVAGYYGVDRYLLPMLGTPWRPGAVKATRDRSDGGARRLRHAGGRARPTEHSGPPGRRKTTRGSFDVTATRSPPRARVASSAALSLVVGHEVAAGRGSSGGRSRRAARRRSSKRASWRPGDRLEGRARGSASDHRARRSSRQNGASTRTADPGRRRGSLREPGERGLDRGLALGAGDARRPRPGEP